MQSGVIPNVFTIFIKRLINPILHGLFGGRERMGGAESAHPHPNVSKPYLCYEIDVEQLVGV